VSLPRHTAIQHSAIRRQLEKILVHGLFVRSERMGRFLRFAVEQTIEGKADELKEYLIGVEVFDRKGSYDPRVDPIVRVEARRLRSKLKAYYEGDGRDDPVIFEFLTGSYAPAIQERNPAPPIAEQGVSTVAVLPFTNLSGSVDNDYFSDGLTEELIHALTKLSGMRVVAWNSAARLRGVERDLVEVRRQLHVGTILTGSVRIFGTSLRVRAQLIDTQTGVYLWSETFDREMQEVFAIQEEIARAIVRTLRGQLAGNAEKALVSKSTSVSAYDYYLKGRYHWHRRTPDELKRSLKYFEAAIEADAESALAYAGVADAFTLLVEYGLVHPAEGVPKVKAAARRAIELDANLAEAYPSLALIRSQSDWEWEEAEGLYRKAIALNPGYATAHHWLGVDCLAMMGRLEEARAENEIALQLDPLSSIIYEGRSFLHILNRNYGEAVRVCREIQEFDPSFYKSYTGMGRALALDGNYREALAMLEKGRSLAGDVPSILAATGQVFALSGDHASARGVLAKLTARAVDVHTPSTCFAIVHIGLGENERALDWLEKAREQHETAICQLKVHPNYDPLRTHPRFQALLQGLRLV
jgi:TolB-like protein/tetratricopeptide (TPR) repeat protein